VGEYRDRKIHQVDPETGKILRTIESNRFVTGVTWIDGELWHGTWEGDESELRRVDPRTGEVLERLEMPRGVGVSGLESDAAISSSAEAEAAGSENRPPTQARLRGGQRLRHPRRLHEQVVEAALGWGMNVRLWPFAALCKLGSTLFRHSPLEFFRPAAFLVAHQHPARLVPVGQHPALTYRPSTRCSCRAGRWVWPWIRRG